MSAATSAETTIPEGVPVIAGTIDAWSEAISVGAQNPGDLMLMYGTTIFLINTVEERFGSATLWGTVGAVPGTRNLAGGMATSGAITHWLRELVGSPDYATLIAEADASGAGAHGLLTLPYFTGERTPIADSRARGMIAGLTVEHTRGDLYRATPEATAFGVRAVGVGGGTQGGLWTQIVSDVNGIAQEIPTLTIGARRGIRLRTLSSPVANTRAATRISTRSTASCTRRPSTSFIGWSDFPESVKRRSRLRPLREFEKRAQGLDVRSKPGHILAADDR